VQSVNDGTTRLHVCLSVRLESPVQRAPETLFESTSPNAVCLLFLHSSFACFFVLFRHSSPNELALGGKVRGEIHPHWKRKNLLLGQKVNY